MTIPKTPVALLFACLVAATTTGCDQPTEVADTETLILAPETGSDPLDTFSTEAEPKKETLRFLTAEKCFEVRISFVWEGPR